VHKTVSAGKGRSGAASLLLHESAHALDRRGYSGRPEVLSARNAAVNSNKIPDYTREYWSQGGSGYGAGTQEFFAESFAIRFKQGRDVAVKNFGKEYVDFLDTEFL
jgi:hypothetical protein